MGTPLLITSALQPFSICLNTSSTSVLSESNVDLVCRYTLPSSPMRFYWYKNNNLLATTNSSNFSVNNFMLKNKGNYRCVVHSQCGNTSSGIVMIDIRYTNDFILIIICSAIAVGILLVLIMAAKYTMKQEIAKAKARNRQNAINAAMTASSSW
ncbi:uncharacterized protein LOC108936805 isoform X1 [Arapaima gigas]